MEAEVVKEAVRAGDQVEYAGPTLPELKGKVGTVIGKVSTGALVVKFPERCIAADGSELLVHPSEDSSYTRLHFRDPVRNEHLMLWVCEDFAARRATPLGFVSSVRK